MPKFICLGCDREAEKAGFCVLCTIDNFRTNGLPLSITEAISIGGPMLKRPDLIVKLVPANNGPRTKESQ